MDSPSPPDLSPNDPPQSHDDPFLAHLQDRRAAENQPASAEGSVDSSGFEKVDHDVLEEYRTNFDRQMQQSIYGQLPDDPDNLELEPDSGFLIVGRKSMRIGERPRDPEDIQLLSRDPTDLMAPPKPSRQMSSSPRDDVVEKDYGMPTTGDLIDIPHNESPPHETAPHLPEPEHHEERPIDVHHSPEPEVNHEPEPAPRFDDLLDFDDQAKALVEDAVREAQRSQAEDFFPEPEPAPPTPEPTREPSPPIPAQEHVHEPSQEEEEPLVKDIHDKVEDILERMQENDDFQEMVSEQRHHAPADDESDLDRPDFRQTPEPEETPYERSGPLTIPEIPEAPSSEVEFSEPELNDIPPPLHHHHHGFETEPRPPTPPRSISEEDVKPSLVNLGHGHPTHSHERHSILKHTPSHEPWFDFKTVDPRVLDIIYWRDTKKSAIAFSLSLLALFILAKYPLLSVIAYTGLAVLGATLGFRIFKVVEAQVKKTGGENPFQEYLAKDISLPQEKVHAQVDVLAEHGTLLLNQAKKLILVESIVDSVKFGLLLWALTYVSAWFSGFTLILLTVIGVFSVPKIYETYQEPIDAQLAVISGHVNNVVQLLEEKLPFLKKAHAEAEKKDQ